MARAEIAQVIPEWYIPKEQNTTLTPPQQNLIRLSAATDRDAQLPFASGLRHSLNAIAVQNAISPWQVVLAARETEIPEDDDAGRAAMRRMRLDRTMYVGCVHGGNETFLSQLSTLADGPEADLPDRIIFAGDLPGAVDQGTIKQKLLFYDHLMNRVGPVVQKNQQVDATELLNASGDRHPVDSPTIRDGVEKLLKFAIEEMGGKSLSGKNEEEEMLRLMQVQISGTPSEHVTELSADLSFDDALFRYIQWIREAPNRDNPQRKGLNSGTWVATLPPEIRQHYAKRYEQARDRLLDPVIRLIRRGVAVYSTEGNEDMEDSLENITYGLETPITMSTFEGDDFHITKKLIGIRGKSTYHLLVPFDILRRKHMSFPDMMNIQSEVEQVRADGLEVIMVAHLQLDWGRHYPGQQPRGEAAQMIGTLQQALAVFQPHQLVYPHQHFEMPEAPDQNAKYFAGSDGNTVVTYLPLGTIGEHTVPARERLRGPNILFEHGKQRQPVQRRPGNPVLPETIMNAAS